MPSPELDRLVTTGILSLEYEGEVGFDERLIRDVIQSAEGLLEAVRKLEAPEKT